MINYIHRLRTVLNKITKEFEMAKKFESGSLADMKEAIVEYLEKEITREDCEAWHNAELTKHMEEIDKIAHMMSNEDFIVEVWGIKNPQNGESPLSIYLR